MRGLPPAPFGRVLAAVIAALALGSHPVAAAPDRPGRVGLALGGQLCRSAISAAAQAQGVPAGLLEAMGQVESGRRDPESGAINPWPWTIDVEGSGYVYETKAEAIAAVSAFQARGIRSIDVGCMQVNLMHHPDAFASLEQAFDPGMNAAYAARFLRQLMDQTHDWNKAAALYHSATPPWARNTRQRSGRPSRKGSR